jgi:hypothetical protein
VPEVGQPTRQPGKPSRRGSGGERPAHSGAFCDPPATGISDGGTPMVCAPAADGRNRWKRA